MLRQTKHYLKIFMLIILASLLSFILINQQGRQVAAGGDCSSAGAVCDGHGCRLDQGESWCELCASCHGASKPCQSSFCPGGPTPPSCSPAPPSKAPLISPPNGAVNVDIPVDFQWGSSWWGRGCPNTNRYRVLYRQRAGSADCITFPLGGIWSTGPWQPSNHFNWPNSALIPNTEYCWLVQKWNNATQVTNSDRWTFTTASISYSIDSAGINTPVNCDGNRISGRRENPNVNNPIVFDVFISHSAGFQRMREVIIGLVPPTGSAGENAAFVNASIIEPKFSNYLGFRVSNLEFFPTTVAYHSHMLPPSYAWAGFQNTGDMPTMPRRNAWALGLNTATTGVTQVDSDTLRVRFTIRFDSTFPTTDLNAYVMYTYHDGADPGTVLSVDATPGNNRVYRKVDTWKTDMQAPFVQVGTPLATGADTFSINWQANDTGTGNSGIRVASSACNSQGGNKLIRDVGLGQNISLTGTNTDCLVTQANLGVHNYQIMDTNPYDNMNFTLTAQDNACNPASHTAQAESPEPWMITARGITSARLGFTGIRIRNINSLTSVLPSLDNDAYLTTYSLIAGNTSLPAGRGSKSDFIATNYEDLNLNSPQLSGTNSWYADLFRLVNDRYGSAAVGTLTLGAGGSINLGAIANPPAAVETDIYLRRVVGDARLNAGSNCGVKTLIFVDGDLAIAPNLTRSANGRCIFVVNGDITIERGTNKNLQPVGSQLVYDTIEAFLIAEGAVTVEEDPVESSPADKFADPLYIKGGVVSGSIQLDRNVTLGFNGIQPSEAIEYDPSYGYLFRRVLAINEFSLREK